MNQADRMTTRNFTLTPALALALSLCMTFTSAACAESSTPAATPDATPAATSSATPAATPAAAPAQDAAAVSDTASAENAVPEEKAAPKFSAGMQIPVDGTSVESFDASLADIKAKATADEYLSLEGAIKYLMVYDLSAGRNKAKLAANLNGLTGEEIVEKVKW